MQDLEKIMEYAKLSRASYKSEAAMRNFLNDGSGLNKKYAVVKFRDHKASGFQCYLLKDTDGGGYVFAFRGTEFIREPVKDTILTDARMMLVGTPQQMYDALEFVAEMRKRYGLAESDAVLTGHSLGGSLAAMASYVFGFEAYAYNPYGIGRLIRSAGSADAGGEANKRRRGGTAPTIGERMKELGVTVKKSESTIHSYVNLGMFAPDFVAGLLTSMTASSHVGNVRYLKDAPGNWLSIIDKHTLAKTLENLRHQRWADEAEAKSCLRRRCAEWLAREDAGLPFSAALRRLAAEKRRGRRPARPAQSGKKHSRRKALTRQRIAYIFLKYLKFLKGGR